MLSWHLAEATARVVLQVQSSASCSSVVQPPLKAAAACLALPKEPRPVAGSRNVELSDADKTDL